MKSLYSSWVNQEVPIRVLLWHPQWTAINWLDKLTKINQSPAHKMFHLLVIKNGTIYYFIVGVRNIVNAGKKNLC